MDTSQLLSCIESLADNIDDLEEDLEPLLSGAITEVAGKLPLLDKAQLYILVTYAIEAVLFSFLRLNGIDAKAHPVYRELTRVKQYFEKVKNAETASRAVTPAAQLDKAAAGRFIKHALAGNNKYEQAMVKQLEERKMALQEKIASHNTRKDQDQASSEQIQKREVAAKTKALAMVQKRKLENGSDDDSDNDSNISKSSSDSDDSSSEASVLVNETKLAGNASKTPPVDTRESAREYLTAPSERKRPRR